MMKLAAPSGPSPWKRLLSVAAVSAVCWASSPAWAGSFEDFFKALRNDNVAQVQQLARRGFDLNTRSEADEPPLIVALKNESPKAAQYLINQPGVDLDATNASGENALMIAALKGYTDVLQALVKRGAEVNKPGWTPLHYAATHAGDASAPMVAFLLEHHAYVDAESPNGSTPLMMAARYGDSRVVSLLLEAGADPSLRNQLGLSAVDFANAVSRPDNARLIAQAIRNAAPKGAW